MPFNFHREKRHDQQAVSAASWNKMTAASLLKTLALPGGHKFSHLLTAIRFLFK